MKIKSKLVYLKYLKNKYIFTLLFLFIWMLFFDRYNMVSQFEFIQELNQLKNDKEFYMKEITQIKSDITELRTNSETLEKFAREKYFMKKDNEDIYIVVEE